MVYGANRNQLKHKYIMKKERTYYVMCDNVTKHICKTKKTAVKYANKFLDTMLYDKVTIDCLTINR